MGEMLLLHRKSFSLLFSLENYNQDMNIMLASDTRINLCLLELWIRSAMNDLLVRHLPNNQLKWT